MVPTVGGLKYIISIYFVPFEARGIVPKAPEPVKLCSRLDRAVSCTGPRVPETIKHSGYVYIYIYIL